LAENLGKKEGIILQNRKEKDRSVKRQKTTDTENGSDSSESTPMIQRANINERVARLLKIAIVFFHFLIVFFHYHIFTLDFWLPFS
jgi:1,4-dihydroxy-2-naphthoate octaprenyltransferase